MEFSRQNISLILLVVGLIMVGTSIWLERRRKDQLMPSLIPPIPLLLLGGTIAFISFVVLILPVRP